MIRKATIEDIDSILSLTKACAEDMVRKGIYQWNDAYPSREAFTKDVARDELYVLTEHSKVIACIVISTIIDDVYRPVTWLSETDANIYIHRLAVHPDHQGKGLAQKLMTHAENYARSHDFKSIRLDTFSKNKRNQRFYKQRGYTQLETIYFPQQSEFPFYCYELIL